MIGPLLSFLAVASPSGPPPVALVARFDCQVRGERDASPEPYREVISLRAWESGDGASIERQFDGYNVNDTGSTQLFRSEPGKLVIGISSGPALLTLERIEDSSGRFFRYGSTVWNPHDLSTYGGFCSSEIIEAPPEGNNR